MNYYYYYYFDHNLGVKHPWNVTYLEVALQNYFKDIFRLLCLYVFVILLSKLPFRTRTVRFMSLLSIAPYRVRLISNKFSFNSKSNLSSVAKAHWHIDTFCPSLATRGIKNWSSWEETEDPRSEYNAEELTEGTQKSHGRLHRRS